MEDWLCEAVWDGKFEAGDFDEARRLLDVPVAAVGVVAAANSRGDRRAEVGPEKLRRRGCGPPCPIVDRIEGPNLLHLRGVGVEVEAGNQVLLLQSRMSSDLSRR